MSFLRQRTATARPDPVLPVAQPPVRVAPKTLRVGFLCPHNPHDATAFSGTARHMLCALADRSDLRLTVLGGHRPLGRFGRLSRMRPSAPLTITSADLAGLDLVVGLTATGLLDRLAERTGLPCIHLTDATPAFLRTAYGWPVPPEADLAEARVIRRAALTVYSSRYMADRAQSELAASPDRIAAIPFGANFETIPDAAPAKPPLSPLRLLWVGSRWERKGGDIALRTLARLRAVGLDATLTLVGDVPKDMPLSAGAIRLGYLDKNRPRQAARLARAFGEAHLFILPTRADCTPMVVAEANIHGTPVLITDTGGIGSLMAEGRNGRMLPMAAGPDDWAAAIHDLTADPGAHAALCRSSFAHARDRLTWEAWARDVTALLRGTIRA